MPVQRCRLPDGRPGYRWGDRGKCYPFRAGDPESEAVARAQAEAQGRAAHAAGYRADAGRILGAPPAEPRTMERRYRAILLKRARLARDLITARLTPTLRQAREAERGDALEDFAGSLMISVDAVRRAIDDVAPIDPALFAALASDVDGWSTRQVQRSLQPVIPRIQVFTGGTEALYRVFIAENVALVTSLDERYFDDLARVIEQAAREGQSTRDLSAELQRRYRVAESRADLVARDQVATLNSQITQHRHEQLGIVEYQWMTAGDERVTGAPGGRYADERPSHYDLDGQIIRYDQPPVSGRRGERAHAGVPINCRCVQRAVVSDRQRARLIAESEERIAREKAIQASILGAPGRAAA